MDKQSYIYIMANRPNGTLYIGVTSDLIRRDWEHKNGLSDGFTKKYSINLLVYYEVFDDIYNAITREKQLKKWKREWNIQLIEKFNPRWDDLEI
ncbi:GIY-YIG nuclease family protein [Shewanella vesiculosa]|uniref:GIY-YIG nuclease family protein n=1 Tax=Shewanella vesiculosa TaxID=518738 RepID=UPI000F4D9E8D|nr:GIY-YIG nuclease family protein [Shewanella vesiculosa]RPA55082.1 GIY-YIG nuclease family protein [Shewanella vesiculosa]UJL44079.1 GIY-YIG nuclease family protein [Shewanella vesiculosa]